MISFTTWSRQNELTQEFRFSSPANARKWKWTAGSYLFGEKIKTGSTTYFDQDYALYDPNAPYASISNGKRKAYGAAFFGQAGYAITPKFDIVVGAPGSRIIEIQMRTMNEAL